MGAVSSSAKQRWNSIHYRQVKVWVPPETAAAFKARCVAEGVSMAGEIAGFMEGRAGDPPGRGRPSFRVDTRQHRRKAVSRLIGQVMAVRGAESLYQMRIPENLEGSCRYEAAEQALAALDEAMECLGQAYDD